MSLRVKAIIFVMIFAGILYLPFAIHAGSGNIFQGDPIPEFNDAAALADSGSEEEEAPVADASAAQYDAAAAQYANCPPAGSGETGLSAAQEQYAQTLPRPELNTASVQMPISIDDMRNHMDVLDQEGRTTDQCLACHTNREEFCDRCHAYSGVSPEFD